MTAATKRKGLSPAQRRQLRAGAIAGARARLARAVLTVSRTSFELRGLNGYDAWPAAAVASVVGCSIHDAEGFLERNPDYALIVDDLRTELLSAGLHAIDWRVEAFA